jgi:hypothetical protein
MAGELWRARYRDGMALFRIFRAGAYSIAREVENDGGAFLVVVGGIVLGYNAQCEQMTLNI